MIEVLLFVATVAAFVGMFVLCVRASFDVEKGFELFKKDEYITEWLLLDLEKRKYNTARVCRAYKFFKKRAARRKNKGIKILEEKCKADDRLEF